MEMDPVAGRRFLQGESARAEQRHGEHPTISDCSIELEIFERGRHDISGENQTIPSPSGEILRGKTIFKSLERC